MADWPKVGNCINELSKICKKDNKWNFPHVFILIDRSWSKKNILKAKTKTNIAKKETPKLGTP